MDAVGIGYCGEGRTRIHLFAALKVFVRQAFGWEDGSENRPFPALEMPGAVLQQYSDSECISGFPYL